MYTVFTNDGGQYFTSMDWSSIQHCQYAKCQDKGGFTNIHVPLRAIKLHCIIDNNPKPLVINDQITSDLGM